MSNIQNMSLEDIIGRSALVAANTSFRSGPCRITAWRSLFSAVFLIPWTGQQHLWQDYNSAKSVRNIMGISTPHGDSSSVPRFTMSGLMPILLNVKHGSHGWWSTGGYALYWGMALSGNGWLSLQDIEKDTVPLLGTLTIPKDQLFCQPVVELGFPLVMRCATSRRSRWRGHLYDDNRHGWTNSA